MKPIKFKESNVSFGDNQKEYLPLPAFRDEDGQVITCWKLSFKERIQVLFSGKLWITMLTFNKPIMPILPLSHRNKVFENETND